jgi:hypothetical protein
VFFKPDNYFWKACTYVWKECEFKSQTHCWQNKIIINACHFILLPLSFYLLQKSKHTIVPYMKKLQKLNWNLMNAWNSYRRLSFMPMKHSKLDWTLKYKICLTLNFSFFYVQILPWKPLFAWTQIITLFPYAFTKTKSLIFTRLNERKWDKNFQLVF